jgi:hypothetical protein
VDGGLSWLSCGLADESMGREEIMRAAPPAAGRRGARQAPKRRWRPPRSPRAGLSCRDAFSVPGAVEVIEALAKRKGLASAAAPCSPPPVRGGRSARARGSSFADSRIEPDRPAIKPALRGGARPRRPDARRGARRRGPVKIFPADTAGGPHFARQVLAFRTCA